MAENEIRPLDPARGEFRQNPDGTRSTEILMTVEDANLNGGRPTNVPTLWMVNGRMLEVPWQTAVSLAIRTGLKLPSFDSTATAIEHARQKSAAGGIYAGRPISKRVK